MRFKLEDHQRQSSSNPENKLNDLDYTDHIVLLYLK